MHVIEGIPVSPGVVIGRVFLLEQAHQRIARRQIPEHAVASEEARLDEALRLSIRELEVVRDQAAREMGPDAANIFSFHIGMLSDPSLTGPMHAAISREHLSAEYAVYRGMEDLASRFAQMRDSAFTTKVNDVRDLATRVLRHLIGEHKNRLAQLDHEAVVVAQDLTPSEAAGFDRTKVVAFATDFGGKTGHTSIVARALGIPAVVGCKELTRLAADGAQIIIDGDRGVVILEPEPQTIQEYYAIIEQRRLYQLSLAEVSDLEAITRDGTHVQILGNIEFPEEIESILRYGGEGVGLYRTEFLYLTRQTEPSEEDHFEAYKRCVEMLGGRTLVIRTVDLGADKYTQLRFETPERNPFLGLRSIRYCLQNLPMFRRQLRALLRASAFGPIKIMFPLITTLAEVRQARWVVRDVMEDLQEERIGFDPGIPLGMMVEVPSAALMADTFAREVDFFSIGTNDLVQYTLAVDRTNERVASMYSPVHPAVLRLVKEVVRAGRRHEIPVSCCGEAAGEREFMILLLGLGVRILSVTSSSIPLVKRLIRSVTIGQCERIAKRAISFDSDVEVFAYVRDQIRQIIPEDFDGRSAEASA